MLAFSSFLFKTGVLLTWGGRVLPWWLSCKESACQCRRHKRQGFHPCLGGEDPLEEEMATHGSILARTVPVDRGAWWATVRGVTEGGHDC